MNESNLKVKWNFYDLLRVILLIMVLIILTIGTGIFLKLENISIFAQEKSLQTVLLFVIQSAIIILPWYFFIVRKYKLKASEVGFKKFPILQGIASIFKGYAIFLFMAYLVSILQYNFGIHVPGFEKQDSHIPWFGDNNLSIFIAVLVVVIIAPLVEEIFFRGFILQTFLNRFGTYLASGISALIFAAAHLEFKNILPLFILGLILNYIFIKNNRSI
ncbi:hypothetical protein A2483_03595, partial [Candidatus Peregrinibacteria bacterium RIFOXYC2_FULL_33_13]